MLRPVIAALMFAVAPLSAAGAQTAPAHDHAAHTQGQVAPPQPSPAAPQGDPMGGIMGQGPMTGDAMGHDHAMMKDGQSCDCPCMKQEKGADAATKKPPAHDHAKEDKQQ